MSSQRFAGILTVVFFSILLPVQAQPSSDHTLYLILHANGKSITVKEVIVKPLRFHGSAPHVTDPYRYVLLSQDNRELYSASFYDPLVVSVDDFSDPQHPKGGKKTLAEASFHLKIPDLTEAVRIRFERKNEQTGEYQPMGTSPIDVSLHGPKGNQ